MEQKTHSISARIEKMPQRIREVFEDYKMYLQMELGRGKNTIDSYCSDIIQFIDFAKDKINSFADVDSLLLAEWVANVYKTVKSSTQSRKISSMRSLAVYLIEEGIWDKNYCDVIARPKLRRPIPEVLEAGEIDEIITVPSHETSPEAFRDRAMLELIYGSGLRVSELCSIKESDIDVDERIIRITGKGKKTRLVPIGDLAVSAISDFRKVRSKIAKKITASELFITRRGKKISRKTFWFNLKKWARAGGITKNVKPHMMRHSFATHMLRNGANLLEIQEMLGHSSLSTTQIYTNLVIDDILNEYNKKHPRTKMDVDENI